LPDEGRDTTHVDPSVHRMNRESEGGSRGIPHLAKNERDVGHPAFSRGRPLLDRRRSERGDAGNFRTEKFSGSVEVEGQLERTGTRAGVAAIN